MDAGTSRSKAIKLKKINHKWETGSGEVKETVQVRKMRKMKRREDSLVSGLKKKIISGKLGVEKK